jgi:hypothetical protein
MLKVGGLTAALGTLLLACAPAVGHWGGADVHDVAGYWIDQETTCALAPPDDCTAAVEAATEWLRGQRADPFTVESATIALRPGAWVDENGQITRVVTDPVGGRYRIAILALQTGERVPIGVFCQAEQDGGACQTVPDLMDPYRVGVTP